MDHPARLRGEDKREDFFSRPLRGCQLVMLRMLHAFDKACAELGLDYWLDSGTLLGAVRHGGFIPWDDDLDVCMMQEDYRRFLAEGQAHLPSDIFLQHKGTDQGYDLPFAKLRDRYSLLVEPDGSEARCMSGIFLDIQPMARFTESQRRWRKVLYLLDGDFGDPGVRRSPARALKRIGLAAFRAVARGSGAGRLIHTALVRGEATWIAYDLSFQRWWPSFQDPKDIFPLTRTRFEDGEFPAPAHVDAYLRKQFGDYLSLPPKEARRPVHSSGIQLTGPNPHPEGRPWPGARAEGGAE